MAFKVKIKNIGKLEDAEICIGQFTVFAGPNNTGKSFVSKLLYSLFNAMNTNHVEIHLNNLFRPVYDYIMMSMRLDPEELSDKAMFSWQSSLQNGAEKLEALVRKASIEEFGNEDIVLEDIIPDLISQMKQMEQIAAEIPQGSIKKRAERRQRDLHRLTNSLIKVKKELRRTNAEDFIAAGIGYEISQNLIQNFQVSGVSDLIRKEGTSSEVVVEDFGKIAFADERIGFEIDRSWVKQLQQYSRVIYLESPVYWKLKTSLENTRDYVQQRYGSGTLSGVPGYFYDLARALKFEYTGEIAFPDVYAKLTGKNVMGGRIAISETGNLSFQENGRNFSLPVTAMGIANLGILALLIERKVLDKGTFLFIDEPEAHLHPAWQVIMAESLFELSRQGVNVVIATHSVDILKWLEVHVKKNQDDEQLIALNQFPVKNSNTEEDFETKMGKIMHELTKPFSDLYIEGI